MDIKNLSTLKIHKLTQAQYDRELAAGNIDENALYLTPNEEVDMSLYTTKEEFDGHKHTVSDVANLQSTLDSKATKSEFDELSETVVDLSSSVETNYDESIIGLSIDGKVITYIKGDGSVHTFETQDTDTTYSLATDKVTGLTKLYATTGSAEDGTMTQKAIKTELDKKVGVSIDGSSNTLIFTI